MQAIFTLSGYCLRFVAKKAGVLSFMLLLTAVFANAQQIAFPGAEGAGRFATGGRGTVAQPTTVFEVTNLNDDNTPGTLRYALGASATTYPYRTIVFRVAGTIHLTSKLNIRSNTTIAGQTAPGGGICLADFPVVISGDNVIVRYIRVRMGDKNQNKGMVDGSGGDDAFGNLGGKNLIIDHCSVSWSSDEALTIYRGDSVTIQWCMVSEPLNYSYHFETGDADFEHHGYGGIWGGRHASFHHNLIAHFKGRGPRFSGNSTYPAGVVEQVDFRNNVIYNWGSYSTNGGEGGNYNVVNNYYKYGPSTSTGSSDGIPIRNMIMNPSKSTDLPYPKVYLDGNYADASAAVTANNWKGVAMAGGSPTDTALSKVTQPFAYESVTSHTATEAYDLVLQKAGAVLPARDTLDQRIINDVKNRTGALIDVQGGYPHGTPYAQTVNAWPALATGTAATDTDHDGMADGWETANGLNPNDAADRAGVAANGYTNLENYLNSVVSGGGGTDPGQAQLPAFPGAEGFAKYATGGRGGKVVEVTTLSDDGPGSFRQAFNAFPGEPITIVFRVGGIIELTSALKVNRSNITIAGQTAPGDGICIKGNSFIINGGGLGGPKGNIIVRYLRSRPGAKLSTGVYGFDMENCYSVIVDHCSFSWANEECAAMYDTKNVTVQWSIISEGLYDAGHAKGVRSYGGVWGGQNASYHHNLIAHQNSRTVRFNGARAHDTLAIIDYRNNVVYNWRSSNACYGGEAEIDNGVSQVNMVNNFYKPGPALSGTQKFVQASYTASLAKGIGQWYLQGNIMNGNASLTSDNLTGLDLAALPSDVERAFARSAAAFPITPALPVQSATDAYDEVLNKAGAVLPVRDAVDARVVQETRNGTASGTGSIGNGIIDDPAGVGGWPVYSAGAAPTDTDHDGMPDSWETANGLNPNDENDRNATAANGYTNLENYLNTIIPASTPTFGTTASMGAFSQVLGSASAAQSYKAGGNNLSGNVTVTAPAGYQLSTDSLVWNTPLVLTPASGTINTKIFVRLNAGIAGNYAGNITHTGSGIPTVNVPVSGAAQTVSIPINADLVVAKDGSGNYTTVQAAIDAAPSNRTTPFIIYIKNGKYKEKVSIPSSKPFIHLVGESAANTIITWDDYSGKVVNGVTIGTSTSATITISAADCMAANITFENSTGYTGDGAQALAINVSGDRCVFKSCRFIGGQDTVLANGNAKRQYFKNCYIDGNTDFIFGSSIAVFDSCVIFPRDRVDGAAGGYVTAANTPPGQAYGYVFRDCKITQNRNITLYTLGRPWQNDAATADIAKSNNKVVFLNTTMGTSIKPEGWSVWDAGTNTSLITYAEYKTKNWDGSLLNTSQRVAWSKQLSDAEAAAYTLPTLFSNWDPCTLSSWVCGSQPVEIAVSNMRVQRSASNSTISWNLSWPLTDVKYELYRSTDSINFNKINEVSSATDAVVAFSVTDALPVAGTTYYYYVKASRQGMTAHNSYIVSVNTVTPLDGEFRTAGSGYWTNAASGNGSNTNSIWEKYVASSSSWVLQGKGVAPNSVNVTIRSGHTVILDALKNCNNLTIESGGVLKSNGGYSTPASQSLRVGAGTAAGVVINNNGVLGGDANPDDLITLEFNVNCASVLITGAGVTKITRLRPLYPNTNPLAVTFDQDVTISYNSGGFTAYYNNAANTISENFTYTINAGKKVKLTNPAGSFNATPNPTPNAGGKYTYNINGTLDLSVTTAVSHAVPFSGNAASVVTINVGNTGVLKLGAGFNTVNSAPGATNGKVVLNIANGGLVDATKTTNLTLGGNYFIMEGAGALKRLVGTDPVLFPIGAADGSYNPVVLTNSGTADSFSVGVKSSFDKAPLSPLQVVNRQWSIAEDVPGASVVEAKFGWITSNQAAGFDATKPLSVMRYNVSAWENSAATVSGTGTPADPYMATATGFTAFSTFGITNSYPSIATNATLNSFSQIANTPSAMQQFSISGMSLTAAIVLSAPNGYELSTDGGSTWSNTLTLALSNGSVAPTTITVRLNAITPATYSGNIKAASNGVADVLIPVTGVTATGPAIVVTGALTAFTQTTGAASAVQTFTISGSNLNSSVTVTPPDNYQVSANGGTTWFNKASPLVLTQTAGSLNTTTISVRLNAATAGSYTGNIANTSTGAIAVNIPVTGVTVPPPATAATGTLATFRQAKGTPSAVQTYTVTGSNLTGTITLTPPVGFEVSANATTWFGNATPLALTPVSGAVNATISVRLNAATAGNYGGNIVQTTTGATAVNMAVTGVTTNPPVVTISSNALKDFSQTLGSASAVQTISLSGADLVANVTLTPPVDYELSADGITWIGKNSTLALVQTAGTVPVRTVQVRLNATATGMHNGTISITTTGSTDISIPVAGNTLSGFTIFPNPVRNQLTIYHPNRYTIGKLYIYSARGVQVGVYYTQSANNSTTINVSALPAGVYFVEYRILSEKVLMKFVKQ